MQLLLVTKKKNIAPASIKNPIHIDINISNNMMGISLLFSKN